MKPTTLASLIVITAACASPYREAPPETTPRRPTAERPTTAENVPALEPQPTLREADDQPTGISDAAEQTFVGSVAADGTVRADTLAGARPDTSRVVRETVVTGAVRSTNSGSPLVTGYRVQVFAAQDRGVAADAVRRLRDRRVADAIYMEWAEPWYKVRVGDFSDRESAERLRSRLVELGFPEAWIVHTTIRTAR